MKTDKTCSKPTRVNAYNRIGGCTSFSYIPESYEIKCGGSSVASIYYSDSYCQSISSVSYYSPADYCSKNGYIEACLLPASEAYTTITFPDTLVYYYPTGNQELRYILADLYADDTCSESAGQSLAFRINSCTYFDALSTVYYIVNLGLKTTFMFIFLSYVCNFIR
jgi:hypothetical protein